METKICKDCKQELPVSEFWIKVKSTNRIRYFPRCRKCAYVHRMNVSGDKIREKQKKYYQIHKEEILSKVRKFSLDYPEKVKGYKLKYAEAEQNRKDKNRKKREKGKTYRTQFLEMYGNKCNCCGEMVIEFLTLDHINGQKGIKRSKKEGGMYAYKTAIVNYRPDLYQILCWNCNCAKGHYGICPHQKEKQNENQ